MAFPHCSVTVKCHNKAKIVCPQGKLGKGPFSMHTKRVIFIIKPFILAPKAARTAATLQWRNAQSLRFKANVMYKSNVIYININNM